MQNTRLKTYTYPADGFDWCAGCDYLEKIHTTMLVEFEDIMVPLCFDCAMRVGEK